MLSSNVFNFFFFSFPSLVFLFLSDVLHILPTSFLTEHLVTRPVSTQMTRLTHGWELLTSMATFAGLPQ